MTVSVQQFRVDFPEFASTTNYPNGMVQFWLTNAYGFLQVDRWGAQLDFGAELFTAHNIALEGIAKQQADSNGAVGQNTGPLSSKSIDGVSVGFDTGKSSEADAGHWNLTIYGTRFIRIARMMGVGPLMFGIGYTDPLNGPGWPGPITNPGFTNFGS